MRQFEKSIFSQIGQDGINEILVHRIYGDPRSHFFVEIGTQDGKQCNTRYFREAYGWNGLLIDGEYENPEINLHKHFITVENIVGILQKYNVQRDFQLLSLDIDQNTFYILKKIMTSFRPDIIDVEYNSTHGPHEDKVVFYYDYAKWDKTNYFGGSLLSFYNMLRPLNYSLVYTESTGADAFFVKNEIINRKNLYFENINDVAKIYNSPKYGLGPDGGHPPDQFDRSYFTADKACFFIGESLYGQ